jgi:altronate dehydratase
MSDAVAGQFEALCTVFEDDLERQENMLVLCRAQGRAAKEHDIELLEARTAAISELVREATDSERLRVALATVLVEALKLSTERQTLSGLIAVAPAPYQGRLADFQTRMQVVLAETREAVRANHLVLRRSARIVSDALESLVDCAPAPRGQYGARGDEPPGDNQQPALLDQRG